MFLQNLLHVVIFLADRVCKASRSLSNQKFSLSQSIVFATKYPGLEIVIELYVALNPHFFLHAVQCNHKTDSIDFM